MDKHKARLLISVIISLAAGICAIVGAVIHLTKSGAAIFAYYTVDSNIFMAIAALIYCAAALPVLTGKRKTVPKAVMVIKYFATVTVSITMLVVIFVLAPYYDDYLQGLRHLMIDGQLLYHHLLCPLLSILAFLFFDPPVEKKASLPFLSLIPTLIYAVVTALLNTAKLLYGPYPFLLVYEQPVYMSVVWFFAIHGIALLIGLGLYFGHRAIRKKLRK